MPPATGFSRVYIGEYQQPTAWANDDGAPRGRAFATLAVDIGDARLPCLRGLRRHRMVAATPRIAYFAHARRFNETGAPHFLYIYFELVMPHIHE